MQRRPLSRATKLRRRLRGREICENYSSKEKNSRQIRSIRTSLHISLASHQLGDRLIRRDVPNSAGCIDRARHDTGRIDGRPAKGGERGRVFRLGLLQREANIIPERYVQQTMSAAVIAY